MNPAVVLALISDLYSQVQQQAQQIQQLAEERDALLAAAEATPTRQAA